MSGQVGEIGSKSGKIRVASGGIDYEEGTWTPSGTSGASVTTIHSADYVRIGNQCTCITYLAMGTQNSSAQIIDGLPFKTIQHCQSTVVNGGGSVPAGCFFRSTDFATTLHLYYQSGGQATVAGNLCQGYH